jgi:L,D-peptidoglycan transpeptidase YkuD (ErfK/YbiS/YcfS/YnhG family)
VLAILHVAVALACPTNTANAVTGIPVESTQLITVSARARSTYASARIWRRVDGCWTPAGGPFVARVGRNGIRANKREGDGATPAGVFPIGPTMFGNSPNPGVRFRYVRLRCGDWWVEDVTSPAYNTFQRVGCGRRPPFRVTTPDMSASRHAYAHFAVIEYNMHPVVPGRGSGIFLHVQIGKPTSGCVSLPRSALVRVLRWLSPAAHPQISIATG